MNLPHPLNASPPLVLAVRAAELAGQRIAQLYGQAFSMTRKEVAGQAQGLVTQADLEAEQAIMATIREQYPEHEILSEESHPDGAGDAPHLWVLDPLDGTNNFAAGIPHFAVSIAYYSAGEPVCGVIHQPLNGDFFISLKSAGAWHNGRRVQVNQHAVLLDTIAAFGFHYDRGKMMAQTLAALHDLFSNQINGVRRFGAAALDLAWVGCGRFGCFFEFKLSPWDFAAGRLFVEEAGGQVTASDGRPLPLASSSLLASNGRLHPQLVQLLSRHWPPPG
ncbi:MAG: inositol monophosphatase family protein [Planctomycetota bacterium]|jgi:myo-inositol-1(or 4)-monophosphatase